MINKFFYSFILLNFIFIQPLFSQGWEKTYTDVEVVDVRGFLPSKDGGYVITGYTTAQGAGSDDGFLMKIDANGVKQWFKTYGGSASDRITGITETKDGYILDGATLSFGGIYDRIYLVRTDFSGNLISQSTIHDGTLGDDRGWGIIRTKDNGYLIYASQPVNSLFYQANAIKLDSNLNVIWDKNYGGTGVEYIYNLIETMDGGYAAIGTTTSYGALGNGDIYLLKLDGIGNEEWHKVYSGSLTDVGFSIYQTPDSGYFAGTRSDSYGAGGNDLYLFKTDKNGNMGWSKTFGTPNQEYHGNLCKSTDGGFFLTATYNASSTSVAGDLWAMKLTEDSAKVVWDKKYGTRNDIGRYILSINKGVIIAGTSANGTTQKYVYVVKTDENGNSLTNEISGTVYLDANQNCLLDGAEKKISNVIINIEPGSIYTSTDTAGKYSVKVDAGSYTVSQVMPNVSLEQICPANSFSVTFPNNNFNTSINNFADKGKICSLLSVDVSTPRLRRCFKNDYQVKYSNEGTLSASNVEIKVEFPETIIPISSTKSWAKDQNIYTFNIGTVAGGESGSFIITDSVSCTVPLGSTHCVEASIYPENNCETVDAGWDKSSVKVEGKCLGDSIIQFTITNTGEVGNGDMGGPSEFRIYVDNQLSYTGQFQLNGGDVKTFEIPANGTTIRLEADQRPGHPGMSRPRETVEGCGEGSLGEISFGFVTQVSEDDKDINKDIDCQTIIGSFDPNEKKVIPEGITQYKYISQEDELEYTIRFQNTGTDTAYTVVIRDTLSLNLDINTFRPGISSHANTYKIYGYGNQIIEWTFTNILLPDSNTNEPGSNGYVKFSIGQKTGNPKGTIIENKAGIIFDYNDPVITNTTRNMVYDTTLAGPALVGFRVLSTNKAVIVAGVSINVYPNPLKETTLFSVNTPVNIEKVEFELFDLTGRLLKKESFSSKDFTFSKNNLSPGLYIYRIMSEKGFLGTGQLVIE